jgi:chemotaxis protein CheC
MTLSTEQKEAFLELANVGFGRAANALSYLVGRRVVLEAPELDVFNLADLGKVFEPIWKNHLLTVHQVFSGKISGDTMLLIDTQNAARLTALMDVRVSEDLSAAADGDGVLPYHVQPKVIDTLSEVGNILLSAFTGSFGNLLRIHVTFTVPRLEKESVLHLIESLRVGGSDVQYAVVVKLYFRLPEDNIGSHLLILMGVDSLESLFSAMKEEGFLKGD